MAWQFDFVVTQLRSYSGRRYSDHDKKLTWNYNFNLSFNHCYLNESNFYRFCIPKDAFAMKLAEKFLVIALVFELRFTTIICILINFLTDFYYVLST